MNIVIPMAGMGKRMRPHTLATPKPLLTIAGKSIVHRIVESLKLSTGKNLEEIHFVIGNFGKEVEDKLKSIAQEVGAQGIIHYQKEALGTAHAVFCAEQGLDGEVLVAFADTMFVGNFEIRDDDEAIIWTKEVDNPENYGVVITNENNLITAFAEKPKEFVSRNAIVGIYYFKNGEALKHELSELINENRLVNGEFQLTDALQALMDSDVDFTCRTIDKWLDCGNKDEFLNSAIEILKDQYASNTFSIPDSKIIPPVFLGKDVKLNNCQIGPNVVIEDNSNIGNTQISNSVVGRSSEIYDSRIDESVIGSFTKVIGAKGVFNIGDYNSYESK